MMLHDVYCYTKVRQITVSMMLHAHYTSARNDRVRSVIDECGKLKDCDKCSMRNVEEPTRHMGVGGKLVLFTVCH